MIGATLSELRKIRVVTTIKIWAAGHGFAYQTVIKLLNGFYGVRQKGIAGEIVAALESDGFIVTKAQAA